MKKIFLALLSAGIIFLACTKPPVEEMNRAIDALNRAENDANAVLYAPNYLSRARDAIDKMQEEANSKRFDSAKFYAAEALSNAEKAVIEGSTGAARFREDALSLLDSLKAPLSETEANLDAAKQVPNILLDFDSLDRSLETANGAYNGAQMSLSAGNFNDAIEKGQNVRSTLGNINAQISGAAIASMGKK